jgi:hypothetical protein
LCYILNFAKNLNIYKKEDYVIAKALTNKDLQNKIRNYIDKNCNVVYVVERGISKDFVIKALKNGVDVYYQEVDGYIYKISDDLVLEDLEKEGFFGNNDCYYTNCYYLNLNNLYDIVDLVLEAVFSDLSLTVTDLVLFDNDYDYSPMNVIYLQHLIKNILRIAF